MNKVLPRFKVTDERKRERKWELDQELLKDCFCDSCQEITIQKSTKSNKSEDGFLCEKSTFILSRT